MSVINDCAVRLLNVRCSAHPISSGNLLFFQIFLSFFLLLLLFSFNAFFTRFRCFFVVVVVIVLFLVGLYRCQLGLSVVCSSFSPALFIYLCAFDMRRKECTQKRSVAGCVFGVTQNANQDVRDDALPCHAMPPFGASAFPWRTHWTQLLQIFSTISFLSRVYFFTGYAPFRMHLVSLCST